MSFNISEITNLGLPLGGARPSQFTVSIGQTPGGDFGNNLKVPFVVQSTQIPASTIGIVEVPYFGRKIKLAGDRTYMEWTTTILNDEDFVVREELEKWSNQINRFQANVRGYGNANPQMYKADATVTQYGKAGNALRIYKFIGLWPSEIATIELDWNTTDTIETYSVTWQYDYWEISGGITGNAGGV